VYGKGKSEVHCGKDEAMSATLRLNTVSDGGVRLQLDCNDGRVATVLLTAEQADALSIGTVDLYNQEKTEVEIVDIEIEGE
jgi:hypothetical protein